MNTEDNNQDAGEAQIAGEGQEAEVTEETVSLSKAEFDKLNQTLGSMKRELKDLKKPKEEAATPQKTEPKTGELDETATLWLEVKGVKTEDADEMKLVEDWRKDSGKDVKAIFASKIFQAELKELRAEREVSDATPSSTKRSGTQAADNVDYWFQKYEQTGTLPTGMPSGMAAKLVDRKAAESDSRRNPFE